MKKIFDLLNRNALFLVYVFATLLLLPFLFLSVFNHPASDDFCYTNFVEGNGFWPAQIKHYLIWTGRYTATFLLTLDPINIHNLTTYKIFPVILLISFVLSIIIFIRTFLPNLHQKNQLIISLLIIFLYLYNTPNIAEAFYWRAGSITYQLASILSFLFFSTVRHLQRQKSALKISVLTFLSCVLAIVIIGLNETSMIILFVIMVLWTFGWFFLKKEKRIEMILILIITIAATAIVIMAPGNAVRMAEKPRKFEFLFSIIGAVKITIDKILSWIPMTAFLVALFSQQFNKMGNDLRSQFDLHWLKLWHLFFFAVSFFLFIVLCFFPSFWSQGGRPPYRTVNVIYLLYIIGTFILFSLFFAFLQEKQAPVSKLPEGVKISLILLMLILLIGKPNNLKRAYLDIFEGTAYRYQLELKERYQLLTNCSEQICWVPALKNRPMTILSSDLSNDPSLEIYYYNECIAHIFRIPKVIVPK